MKQSQATVRRRHQKILEYFKNETSLSVKDLSERLKVSDLTVRRDLDGLANKGLIKRFHGGARVIDSRVLDTPEYDNKNILYHDIKVAIAKVVASYIKDGDTVFLNGGTTTFEIIKYIKDRSITIVTNHAIAYSLVGGNCRASLLCTGGEYSPKTKSYSGLLATTLINKLFANICILGVNGVTFNEGLTSAYYPEILINEEFINRTNGLKIIAADGSKLGKVFGFTSASIDNIDILITDSSADPEELAKLRKSHIEIILVAGEQ